MFCDPDIETEDGIYLDVSYFTKHHQKKNCTERNRLEEDREYKEEVTTGYEEALPMSRDYSPKNPEKGFMKKLKSPI